MMNKYRVSLEKFSASQAGLLIISTLIPMLAMMVVWIFMGVFPFGDKTLMSIDFGQQYISLYQFLKETILTGDWSGFFYSFSKSIGGGMIGIWGFNLISPFNLLYVITPTEHFRWMITITIWLRYGATALTFAYLLIRNYKGNEGKRRFLVPVMAAAYAMSGMIVAYQMNPIFYDSMIMLPLVIAFLEDILEGKSAWKYVLTLSLSLLFHFYMGYMMCLFVAIYSVFYMMGTRLKWKEMLRPLLRAFLYSILAVGTVMWLLYPIFLNLLISKGAYSSDLSFEFKMQIQPLDVLSKFMIGAFDSQSWPAGPNLPNLFIGSLALFGFFTYFWKKEVPTRQKVAAGLIMGIFFIAIVNVFFNKIWHMGQTPAGFFYRFSWIISFFMVLLAYQGLKEWKQVSWTYGVVAFGFLSIASYWTLTHVFTYFDPEPSSEFRKFLTHNISYFLMGLISVISIFLMVIYRNNRKKILALLLSSVIGILVVFFLGSRGYLGIQESLSIMIWLFVIGVISFGFKPVFYMTLSVLTILELSLNAFISQNRMNYDNANHFQDAQVSVKVAIDQIRPSQEGEFYRINKLFERSKNDPFMYDYPGLTHFSSNMERSTLSFMTKVGDSGSNASSYYGNGTAFMDAFYGVRYVIDYIPKTQEERAMYPERRYFYRNTTRKDLTERYTLVWENDRYRIYENTNVLSPAFAVPEEVVNLDLKANQLVTTHNKILSAMAGSQMEVFKSYLFESTELENVQIVEEENGKKLYRKIDPDQDGVMIFKFTPKTNGTYYINAPLSLKRQKGGKTDIQLNGAWYEYQHSFDGQQLWNVAHNQSGQEITLKLIMKETQELNLTNLYLISADQTKIDPIISQLKEHEMKVTEWRNNYMKGTVVVGENTPYMMTSIPYNVGWTVKVDGHEIPTKETWDALMAFPISPGQHTIEMYFIPDGWYQGLAISGISLISVVGLVFWEKRRKQVIFHEKLSSTNL